MPVSKKHPLSDSGSIFILVLELCSFKTTGSSSSPLSFRLLLPLFL